MYNIDTFTIVGHGKVGGAIQASLTNVLLDATHIAHAGVDDWLAGWRPFDEYQVIVLAIPAHAIGELVQKMTSLDLSNTLVTHTNGSMQPDVLAPLQNCGAQIAATHPYQTFTDADAGALDGIAWGVECAEDAWEAASTFIDLTGGLAVHLGALTAEQKRIYHASAVAASNFSYAAYSLARKLANDVHIDAATFLSPIMERTLQNAVMSIERNEPFGITGPLARGDEKAVVDQLNALPAELRRTYAACSLGLLDALALRAEQKEQLRIVLRDFIDT